MNRSSLALAALALVPFAVLACGKLGADAAVDAAPPPSLVPLVTATAIPAASSVPLVPVQPPHPTPGHPHPTPVGEGGVPSGPTAFPFPSSLPSGFPTALPSGFPTALPSGFPTALPSGLPTAIPSTLPLPKPAGTTP